MCSWICPLTCENEVLEDAHRSLVHIAADEDAPGEGASWRVGTAAEGNDDQTLIRFLECMTASICTASSTHTKHATLIVPLCGQLFHAPRWLTPSSCCVPSSTSWAAWRMDAHREGRKRIEVFNALHVTPGCQPL